MNNRKIVLCMLLILGNVFCADAASGWQRFVGMIFKREQAPRAGSDASRKFVPQSATDVSPLEGSVPAKPRKTLWQQFAYYIGYATPEDVENLRLDVQKCQNDGFRDLREQAKRNNELELVVMGSLRARLEFQRNKINQLNIDTQIKFQESERQLNVLKERSRKRFEDADRAEAARYEVAGSAVSILVSKSQEMLSTVAVLNGRVSDLDAKCEGYCQQAAVAAREAQERVGLFQCLRDNSELQRNEFKRALDVQSRKQVEIWAAIRTLDARSKAVADLYEQNQMLRAQLEQLQS